MHSPYPNHHDVVIAGGGPVGLFLACELRLFGLSVVVLEQAADPRLPLKRLPFGRRGLWVPTLEAFYRRGLLDAVKEAQQSNESSGASQTGAHWMQGSQRPGGHFAGIPFFEENVDDSLWPYRLRTPAGTSLSVDMESLEAVLSAHASAMGVDIRRGVTVEGFAQTEDEVVVRTGRETFRSRWLVGCDGARSVVRKMGGFDFVGTEPEFTGYSVHVEMEDPDALQPGRTYTSTGMYTYARPGIFAVAEFDGGAFHRTDPITLEHVQAVLRRVSQTDVALTTLRIATTWTDRAYQATTYRRGRVLLAGDAAHIHSPLGGQGLNLGLGDAVNLGWKLAYTHRGDAPANLLDSYSDEQHRIGKQVLDWSRAQVALMRPSPGSRALADVIRQLVDTRDGATYFAGRVWGVGVRHDLGVDHPLAGRSVPDFVLSDGTRMGSLLSRGKGLWLDFDTSAPCRELAARWHDRVTYIACNTEDSFGLDSVLVRPDGIVAWAGEGSFDLDDAGRAALRWFGNGSRRPGV